MPSRLFWLANILFWLLVNVLLTWHYYYKRLSAGKPAEWFDIWLKTLPDGIAWSLITPVVITGTVLITLEHQSLFKFIIKNLIFMFITLLAFWGIEVVELELINAAVFSLEGLQRRYSIILFSPIQMDIVTYLAIFFTGHFYAYYQKSRQQALHNEQLARQLVQVELQSLKSQLNPHFLFNTLNSITGLIRLDRSANAITALSELGLMLRRVLENQHNQMTTLEKEMEFINSYLTIQKMRFEHKLDASIEVEDDCLAIQLPFMLLQPLVENAVQHGTQLESNKNILKLHVYCEDAYLKIKLINKMPEKSEHQGFGIGLKNCRQRMKILYGDNFELKLTELKDNYFETFLSLPIGDYVDEYTHSG